MSIQMQQRMQYTDDERAEALRLLAQVGKAEAARRTGIPSGTIASWGSRLSVAAPSVEAQLPALQAKATTIAQRKAALAERMLGKAEAILGQLDASVVEKHVKVVSMGHAQGSSVEIVDVTYDRPPTADQKRIVDTVAVLVDKIQLLTGDVTARTELTGSGEPVQRKNLLTVVEQLADRAKAS